MKCNTCNTEFVPFPMMDDQAAGCAATLYLKNKDYYILGHYGSMHTGNICDDCISKLVNEGSASLIEDGVW
jgi:hypothetical protein